MTEATYRARAGPWEVTTFVNGRFNQNAYLAVHADTRRAVAVDPGGRVDDLAAAVESETNGLDGVLLTHGHFDHIGAVDALASRFSVRCLMHRGDQKLVRQASIYALRLARASIRPPASIEYFDEPPELDWGGEPWRVLLTPGHTPGSVCFLSTGVVFTGDLLFNRHVTPAHYPGSSVQEVHHSIEHLLAETPSDGLIFAGHGRPWTAGEALDWWRDLEGSPPTLDVFTLKTAL